MHAAPPPDDGTGTWHLSGVVCQLGTRALARGATWCAAAAVLISFCVSCSPRPLASPIVFNAKALSSLCGGGGTGRSWLVDSVVENVSCMKEWRVSFRCGVRLVVLRSWRHRSFVENAGLPLRCRKNAWARWLQCRLPSAECSSKSSSSGGGASMSALAHLLCSTLKGGAHTSSKFSFVHYGSL